MEEADDDRRSPSPPPCPCRCCSHGALAKRRPAESAGLARVGADEEALALRNALSGQQSAVVSLQAELEEERSASASAASEAMSMILRLQHERADALLEARQFRRLAEERIAHDQTEIAALEDLLFKRDQAIQELSLDLQALRQRVLSCGLSLDVDLDVDVNDFDYPPLRCYSADPPDPETPRSARRRLGSFELRINQLERSPSDYWSEKGVVVGKHRPVPSGDYFSVPSSPLSLACDPFPLSLDREWDAADRASEVNDRVYTVDAVHGPPENYVSTPRELKAKNAAKKSVGESEGEEGEIKKLYARLQALEADRESMRQTIMSMSTDMAQVLLLREIAQHLGKEDKPERKVVKRRSFFRNFSIAFAIKWVLSFIFWRRNAPQIRYTCGLSTSNVGLLLLLERSARMRLLLLERSAHMWQSRDFLQERKGDYNHLLCAP